MPHSPSPYLWLLPLLLGASIVLLPGCQGPPPSPDRAGSVSAGSGSDPGRAPFESIALPTRGTIGADPEPLARDLFGTDEPIEGNYTETVSRLAGSADQQVLLFTRMGLPDDSVLGMRYRLELVPRGAEWELSWVGRQFVCRPGRGHQDWGTAPCL